jgi:hypothetical protein
MASSSFSSSSFSFDSVSFPHLSSSLSSSSATLSSSSSSVLSSSSLLASAGPNSVVSSSINDSCIPKSNWSNLFKSLPRNAGSYKPIHFDISRDKPSLDLPDLVKVEGLNYWNNHLVGFFLDGTLSFLTVVNFLKRFWKLKGEVDFKSDGYNFYFNFSNQEDKDNILNSDPIFIRGRMFIITKWDPSVGLSQAQVKKVPIWIHFHRIPIILWTLVGINWLACHIGRLICFDSSTEKLQRFKYAKALVEISPDQELPESIHIPQLGNNCPDVQLSYVWKPKICTHCRIFGHDTATCEFVNSASDDKDNNIHSLEKNEVRTNTANPIDQSWKVVNKKNKGIWRKKVTLNNENIQLNVDDKRSKEAPTEVIHISSCSDANDLRCETSSIFSNPSLTKVSVSESPCDVNLLSSSLSIENPFNALSDSVPKGDSTVVSNSGDLVGVVSDSICDANLSSSSISLENPSNILSNSVTRVVSTVPSNSVSTSCCSQFSSKSPSMNIINPSPYLHLSPPSNVLLPPPSSSSDNAVVMKKSSGVSNLDSVDLNKGKEYKPSDVQPLSSSKNNSHQRHTRKNPSSLFPPLPNK